MDKTVQPPWRAGKNKQTALTGVGNAPLLPPAAASFHGKASHVIFRSLCSLTNHVRLPPRRGKFALRSASELISTSMHSTAKSSPSGEKVVPKVPKGVHFLRAIGAVVWFFLCYCPICKLSPPPSTKRGPLPQAAFITPSEPARSVGGTHRSVRQHMTDRTRAPKAPEPSWD